MTGSLFDKSPEGVASSEQKGADLANKFKAEAADAKAGKKEPKAKKEKPPVDPNAPKPPRAAPVKRVPAGELSLIHVNQEKVSKYKGERRAQADKLKDGATIKDYKAVGGDLGFLRFFAKDGAVTFTEVAPEPKPEKVKAAKEQKPAA